MEIEIEPTQELHTQKTTTPPAIPWLDTVSLRDRKIVVAAGEDGVDAKHTVVDEEKNQDFKTFVLTADNRPIDFQVMQMMLSLKHLMDVCEKQQVAIESLQAALRNEKTFS